MGILKFVATLIKAHNVKDDRFTNLKVIFFKPNEQTLNKTRYHFGNDLRDFFS
jgi:hypothetical protein